MIMTTKATLWREFRVRKSDFAWKFGIGLIEAGLGEFESVYI